jgi:serine/threonine protein kinase
MVDNKMKKYDFSGNIFELPERYEPIKIIGKGTYGAVVSATDNLTNEKVAIKKLSKIEDMVIRIHHYLYTYPLRLMPKECSEKSSL